MNLAGTLAPPGMGIRVAIPSDAMAVARFAAASFAEAFGSENDPADLARHLATHYSAERQGAEITDPRWVTLIAESGGPLAGFAQLHEGTPPDCVEGPAPLELARFYVGAAWHGRGVAQALMAATIATATGRGARTLWLGVWERNPRAIRFYAKSGFLDRGEKNFTVGTDVQRDRVLVRSLSVTP